MTQSPRLCMVYQRLDTWIFRQKSHDTRCYFNVHSKADVSQLSLPHGTNKKVTMDMLRSIGKQSRESVESVKKKRKAMVGRICRKERI